MSDSPRSTRTTPVVDAEVARVTRRIAAAYPDLSRPQAAGVAFLLARRRAILADDAALDPARQSVLAMHEAEPSGPILVIVPTASRRAWEQRIAAVDPASPIGGTSALGAMRTPARWTVATHEQLAHQGRDLVRIAWAGLIVDEAHRIRNLTKRTAWVLRLAGVDRGIDGDRGPGSVHLLTPTPMPERPRDLFNLLLVVRHPAAASFRRYALRFCAATEHRYGLATDGTSNAEELAAIAAEVMLGRTMGSAEEEPPVLVRFEMVTTDDRQVA